MTTADAERDDQLLLLASATEAAVQDTDRWHPEFPYVNILHANLKYADLYYSVIQDDTPNPTPTPNPLGANVRGADHRGAHLQGTNLRSATAV